MTNIRIPAAAFAAACIAAFSAAPAAWAAGPSGFEPSNRPASTAPQGFGVDSPKTVADVIENARDDERVTLVGKFSRHIRGDKYEFVDASGKSIAAELDDDRDWSMIVKDQPVEITAEVDRDWTSVELDVKSARPLK